MAFFLMFGIVVLLAAILQTSTGFGFSIMATPFLLLLFEPKEAIQINLILSLFISCILVRKIKKDMDLPLVKRFVAGSAAGLPIGMIIFLLADLNKLKLAISIVVLILTILLMCNLRVRRTNARDLAAGGLSGILTTSIGMPGPPILLYFSGTKTGKEKLRATTLSFYLFVYSISLIAQIIFAGTTKVIWLSSAAALPIVLAGLFFGQLLFERINQRAFQIGLYLLLLFTGVYLLIDSW